MDIKTIEAADAATDAAAHTPQIVYKSILVFVEIDTTGRRLIDEIVQLAAYSPSDEYSQFILPHGNINHAARQRHQVRIVNAGLLRMLKSLRTNEIIKTRTEMSALIGFLEWLEYLQNKEPTLDGIVLVYNEKRKFTPYLILQALLKCGLLERFNKVVKHFVNSYILVNSSFGDMERHNLYDISQLLFNQAQGDNINRVAATRSLISYGRLEVAGNARIRARVSYMVTLAVANQHQQDFNVANVPVSEAAWKALFLSLMPYAEHIDSFVDQLGELQSIEERQKSFRPVFFNYFTATATRVRAVRFRIALAENGYDLADLNSIWTDSGVNGLHDAMGGIADLQPEDRAELVHLLDSFFDPAKMTLNPNLQPNMLPGDNNPL